MIRDIIYVIIIECILNNVKDKDKDVVDDIF